VNGKYKNKATNNGFILPWVNFKEGFGYEK